MDKWKGKAFDGQTYSERKRGRENRMAEYAARNWGRSDVQDILKAMGTEQKTIDGFSDLTFEQIKAKMMVLFFRR